MCYFGFRYWESWTEYFNPEKQIMVVNYQDLIDTPYEVVHKVETFLGLEHTVKPEMIYFDERKGFYCKYTNMELNITRCMSSQKGRQHPDVPNYEVNKLKRFFKPWNEKFFAAIGEDFGWNDGVS